MSEETKLKVSDEDKTINPEKECYVCKAISRDDVFTLWIGNSFELTLCEKCFIGYAVDTVDRYKARKGI